MAMHCFAKPQIASLSAGFESRRVSVVVTNGVRGGVLLAGVEENGFMRHVVANEADDDGVPHSRGWAGNSVEQLASQMGLALLAYFA